MNPEHGYHKPVLLQNVIKGLAVKPDGIYLDCTLGGGGHFNHLVDLLGKNGIAIGIDRDPTALKWVMDRIKNNKKRVLLEQSSFSEFDKVLNKYSIKKIDGILLDLGLSSRQIDDTQRGFSYKENSKLDMRMNPGDDITAEEILISTNEDELADILKEFGEIRNPGRMARVLVNYSKEHGIHSSDDLRKCLECEYGAPIKFKILAKVFQALRIAVNNELNELRICLKKAVSYLNNGGRLVVIAYHSLEDRIVKNFFRDNEKKCICKPNELICKCDIVPKLKRITRKAVKPSNSEICLNSRARSARLRIAEKII